MSLKIVSGILFGGIVTQLSVGSLASTYVVAGLEIQRDDNELKTHAFMTRLGGRLKLFPRERSSPGRPRPGGGGGGGRPNPNSGGGGGGGAPSSIGGGGGTAKTVIFFSREARVLFEANWNRC